MSIICPFMSILSTHFSVYKDTFAFYKNTKCVQGHAILMSEYKSALGARPGPDNNHKKISKIQIHENAGFCNILCIDDFKILKILNYRNFPRFFTEKRHRRQPPTPPPPTKRPYDVSRGQNRDVTLP